MNLVAKRKYELITDLIVDGMVATSARYPLIMNEYYDLDRKRYFQQRYIALPNDRIGNLEIEFKCTVGTDIIRAEIKRRYLKCTRLRDDSVCILFDPKWAIKRVLTKDGFRIYGQNAIIDIKVRGEPKGWKRVSRPQRFYKEVEYDWHPNGGVVERGTIQKLNIEMKFTSSLTLDVGCGWLKGKQTKRGMIGIDIHKGMCDIQADAHHLPFKNETFNVILARAVLEHLENPKKALEEIKRVARKNAYIEIEVPMNSNWFYTEIKRLIMEFPFAFTSLPRKLLDRSWIWKYKGSPHLWQIPIWFLKQHLDVVSVEKSGGRHAWTYGRIKGRIVRKLLKGRRLGGYNWLVEARK